jgi:pimeloyl-ACP methyl ester carboxylesterase
MLHDVGGVRLNAIDEGEGQAILFLHGLGGSWRDWAPQLDHLRDGFRVIAVDHRGHGRSEATRGRYTTGLFAADAVALCRGLGVEHAHVVGLSMGGLVAQRVALDHPGFVDCLVVCDSGAYMPRALADPLLAVAAAVRENGMTDSRGVVGPSSPAWSKHTLANNPQVVRDNGRESESTDPDQWAKGVRAVVDHDTRGELGAITVPTLVVYGEEDGLIVPAYAAPPLMDGLPDAELLEIPDAGHVVNLEQPEAFDAALLAFFAAHPVTR